MNPARMPHTEPDSMLTGRVLTAGGPRPSSGQILAVPSAGPPACAVGTLLLAYFIIQILFCLSPEHKESKNLTTKVNETKKIDSF